MVRSMTGMESTAEGRPELDLFADDPLGASLAGLVRELDPGARLPSERDLAVQLRVSRTALRDRLRQLEALGVLRRRGGSGTFVEQPTPAHLTLTLNMAINAARLPLSAFESVRIGLERQAAKEATRNADPILIAHMRKAVDVMATSRDLKVIREADRLFHQSLLRASGNPASTFLADALSGVLERDLEDRVSRAGSVLVAGPLMDDLHRGIYDAVYRGDERGAMDAVDRHFDTFAAVLRRVESAPEAAGPRDES